MAEVAQKETEALPPEEKAKATDTSATEQEKSETQNTERGFSFWIIASIAGSIGLCLLLFVVAMAAGTISGRWENVAALVSVIRDLMLIFLILQAILIGVALIAMVVQLSALVNLLQNEIQPILDSTQQASKTVTGTAQFISQRVTTPVVRTFAILAGARAFFREIGSIRKAIKPSPLKQKGVVTKEGSDEPAAKEE